MKIEKRNLNEALRVLGKVVCQTSPVELYRSVRFVGNADGVTAMATDGIETVAVQLDAETESDVDFCVPFRELKDLIRINRSETLELEGSYIEFPDVEEPELEAVVSELPDNFTAERTRCFMAFDTFSKQHVCIQEFVKVYGIVIYKLFCKC